MAKQNLQQLLNEAKSPIATKDIVAAHDEESNLQKPIADKQNEVKTSAFQAKTGKNVKPCLAKALADYFRKYNFPVTVLMN
ncbi:MAG: hypothetical protein ACKN9T_13785 [Candidatus Methylumidiphilus sp.]|jgi:hypothetical protein